MSTVDQAPLSACECWALKVSSHSFPGGVYADSPLCLSVVEFPTVAKSRQASDHSWPDCWALSLQSCTQEMVEELVYGFQFAISLEWTQVNQSLNDQGWSEVSVGAEGSSHPGT